MNKVICGIAVSLDGYVAGKNMTEEKPMGDIPDGILHEWMFDEPEKHEEELQYLKSVAGAYIMGRNMFGPKGQKYDTEWTGWWGEEPPYHTPVFVLTHRKRDPIEMEGGTTFFFVTDGIEEALQKARKVAGEKPVAIAGGAETVNQYLREGLIDEIWLHLVPVTLGSGQQLFDGVPDLRMQPISLDGTKLVTHIKYKILRG